MREALEVSLLDIGGAGGFHKTIVRLDLERASGVERSVVEKRAQPRSQSFAELDDVGLVEVVSEHVHRDRLIVDAFVEQIEHQLARMPSQPLVSRLEGLSVVVRTF